MTAFTNLPRRRFRRNSVQTDEQVARRREVEQRIDNSVAELAARTFGIDPDEYLRAIREEEL